MTEIAPGSETQRQLPLPPDGAVEISVAAADLSIRATDGDTVVVRGRGGATLPDGLRVEADGSVVRIKEGNDRFGGLMFAGHRTPHLDVDLPRRAPLAVRTMSGDVEAAGLAAPSRWASASGDLRIATAGGELRVETMSGDAVIEATGSLRLNARTVSGDLRVRAPRVEALDASTTSGDVVLEGELGVGPRHHVSSVSGDVSIATPSPVTLEAQTIAGDIRASGPHASRGSRGTQTFVVGDGSVTLSVKTTSGDVRLRVTTADSGASEMPVAPAPVHPVPPVPPVPPVVPVPPVAPVPPARSPVTDEDTQAWSAPEPQVDRREAARLDVLRALERGELDVEAASRRLEALDEAGPLAFRGWC